MIADMLHKENGGRQAFVQLVYQYTPNTNQFY